MEKKLYQQEIAKHLLMKLKKLNLLMILFKVEEIELIKAQKILKIILKNLNYRENYTINSIVNRFIEKLKIVLKGRLKLMAGQILSYQRNS